MLGLVLLVDLFYQNTFPWYLGRILFRGMRLAIAMGIGAALGAFLGTVSLQFRFIVHLIAAAPIPLVYIIGGCLSVAIYIPLGLFARKKKDDENKSPNFGGNFGQFEDFDDYTPVTSGTTTLIGQDGTSYPVYNVGYGYMVNGKMLIDFDPHDSNRPVDEYGNEYTRY